MFYDLSTPFAEKQGGFSYIKMKAKNFLHKIVFIASRAYIYKESAAILYKIHLP